MPDAERTHPAILIMGFDGGEACLAMALGLAGRGYAVVAACAPGGASALASARGLDCAVIEAKRGDALRRGMEYFQRELADLPGLVVLPMDEGYVLEDVLRVAEELTANPGKMVIASRAGNNSLGLLSRLERFVAWMAFAALHGRPVRDPWTGLKGLPVAHIPELLSLQGSGSKFAFNMLVNMQHKGIRAVNVPVDIPYAYDGDSGFWDRALDVGKIFLLPLKFISSSVAATLADNAVFLMITKVILPGHWIIALTACRSTGTSMGYLINRNVVFRQSNNSWKKELLAALKFALLALFNYGASLLLIGFLHKNLLIDDFLSKLMSDAVLFSISFTVQREFIFHRKHAPGNK